MRSARSIAFVVLSAIGIGMLCVPATAMSARLVWNFTPSIPTGLYSIEDRPWGRGDRVAIKPSGRLLETLRTYGVLKDGRLLMKGVAAVAGDKVCRTGRIVSINGEGRVEARGDDGLPAWSGCVRLAAGDVFLLGETLDSFDGRYFGVTSGRDISGPLMALLTF